MIKSKARCMLIVSGFELIFCYSYVSVLFFSGVSRSTVALYTTPFWRHWPLSGQDFLSLQLQVFPCFSLIFVDSRTVLLWLEIICFIFCCAFSITSHDKWCSVFDSLSFHMNSLKVVADFLWLSLKLYVC